MGVFVLRFLLMLMLIGEFDLFSELIGGQNWVSQSELFIEKVDDAVPVFVKVIEMDEMLFMKDVWSVWSRSFHFHNWI